MEDTSISVGSEASPGGEELLAVNLERSDRRDTNALGTHCRRDLRALRTSSEEDLYNQAQRYKGKQIEPTGGRGGRTNLGVDAAGLRADAQLTVDHDVANVQHDLRVREDELRRLHITSFERQRKKTGDEEVAIVQQGRRWTGSQQRQRSMMTRGPWCSRESQQRYSPTKATRQEEEDEEAKREWNRIAQGGNLSDEIANISNYTHPNHSEIVIKE